MYKKHIGKVLIIKYENVKTSKFFKYTQLKDNSWRIELFGYHIYYPITKS